MGRRRGSLPAVAVCVLAAACGTAPGAADGAFTPSDPGVLVVATNLPAPGFWDGGADAPTGGFEFLLAQAIAERLGLERIRVVDLPFTSIAAGDLGGADLALSQITVTDEREDVLDFTTSYLDSHPAVVALPGTDVPDLAAARELTWVVQVGTTQARLLDEIVQPDAPVVEAADIASVVDGVIGATAQAGLLDLPTALVQERLTGGAVRVVAQFSNEDGLTIAVPEGSENLEALDSAVRALLADGTIREFAEQTLGRDSDGTRVEVPVIRSREVAP